MTSKVWEDIVGLSLKWMMVNDKGLQDASVKFNKVTKYKALMKDPSTFTTFVFEGKGKERFGTSPLLLEHKLLVYLIDQIITPKGINHAQLTEEDLLLIYLMQGKMKLNWVSVVVDNMLNTKRIGSFKCPQAVLISKILDHFKVDT